MTHRSFLGLATLSLVALAAGCTPRETLNSNDVATHGMSLNISANSTGTNTTVEVELHVGSADSKTVAKLTPDDHLILKVAGKPDRLLVEKNNDSYRGTYYALDVGETSGDFIVDFTRTKGASALGNKMTLPPPFTLLAIPGPISRKEPLIVKWDRADGGHDMTIALDGSCIQTVFARSITGDPGTYTFNAGDIKSNAGQETANCSINIRVARAYNNSNNYFSSEFGQPSKSKASHVRVLAVDSKP